MPKIFISYRHDDSAAEAGRIYSEFTAIFGEENVIKDVDTFPVGGDFRTAITEGVIASEVMLVLIGKDWLTITNASGQRRLDDPDDFVRYEVDLALRRAKMLVVPVILSKARPPGDSELPNRLRELAYKNAAFVRDDPDFSRDIKRLIKFIQEQYPEQPKPTTTPKSSPTQRLNTSFVGSFVAILAIIISAFIFLPPLLNNGVGEGTQVIDNPSPTGEIGVTESATNTDTPTDESSATESPTFQFSPSPTNSETLTPNSTATATITVTVVASPTATITSSPFPLLDTVIDATDLAVAIGTEPPFNPLLRRGEFVILLPLSREEVTEYSMVVTLELPRLLQDFAREFTDITIDGINLAYILDGPVVAKVLNEDARTNWYYIRLLRETGSNSPELVQLEGWMMETHLGLVRLADEFPSFADTQSLYGDRLQVSRDFPSITARDFLRNQADCSLEHVLPVPPTGIYKLLGTLAVDGIITWYLLEIGAGPSDEIEDNLVAWLPMRDEICFGNP